MATHFKRKGKRLLGIDRQSAIRFFFGGNAMISILVLGAICLFLAREAVLFFPQHQRDLEVFRLTGQEYANFVIEEMDEFTEVKSLADQAFYQEMNEAYGIQRGLVDCYGALNDRLFDNGEDLIDELEDARDELDDADGEEEETLAQADLDGIQSEWDDFLRAELGKADRKTIDSFGRLGEKEWQELLDAMASWDPVEDEPPALVNDAKAEMTKGMAAFDAARMQIGSAGSELARLRSEIIKITTEIKTEAVADMSSAARKKALLEGSVNAATEEARASLKAQAEAITIRENFPYSERIKALEGSREKHEAAVTSLKSGMQAGVAALPTEFASTEVETLVSRIRERTPGLFEYLDTSLKESADWRYDEPVSWLSSVSSFFFGKDWVTNSSFHDFYGLLPLFTGSLLISIIALIVAIPFSLGAAIYVNRLAGPRQQNFIKPVIELIGAIPSVVLGFFGIIVLGEALRQTSQLEWLSWVPGFPMQERLNILNAGLLLALMAVPTIFTLCEDAINNVPSSFTEASLALGGSKLQTVMRIVVPAAISGIFAAILLGFGRVIGETMVVLLVAGNQIAIPDFGLGVGVITQPAHTMTGIIAQEMGEVTADTIHYRALFSVGLVLFTISLLINISARRIIKRFGLAA
ncbi:MAG: phosphate ABC transporter permease subunit PstC [Akkermansiaceae bacterium]|jgi:phosphate transport system permease protein|nr:phosphate ABC transporter permease subunit PstC [Akkermansiaceae bacterium]MDP4645554.1 phosphate ABC transporter permease subunit PstC [Akkermansiaceae bacterium]MDP4720363.1 phosphate ABC transporter permease subunit PstC [Akkermansiaceae bacterium]MDP4779362.1 phosphate ABC transporter permease subunit PstC [Akkermansiaceae bacterium]MDP4896661.1 phosphate ABC transporter permease subunit PstC [Akkermansiaceae bacterium]